MKEDVVKELSPEDEAVVLWNEFIARFVEVEEAWVAFSNHVEEYRLMRSEQLPLKIQRMLAKFGKQAFHRMGPEFVTHARGLGGMLDQKV